MVVESRVDLLTPEWDWRALRDYITSSLKALGRPPETRPPAQVAGIYRGFISRWGPVTAERIARYAIEVERGTWRGQSIDAGRFTAGSDPHFGVVIAHRLIDAYESASA